ncbi:subtilisin family serine protease [Flavobacterium sp. 7E]|uniref:S8 family peptidase n=1 Tax=unclassified Flavobacterium TaxID=196869 RepID=UPI00156DA64A|nr:MULTISPECIES: S8 family peptidase [unclassified Flavobacterium]MBE0390575.1 Thermophilic serine proteinase [Flavobacterium sp. PL002]NRS88740.1 subtilisin family serine protease [Flavobacterium sp. 7E]NRT14371.1 subtilisin family serine protease [Flavobacterium sp. 28A]
MNTIKPICISAFAVLVLAGCGAQKQVSSFTSLIPITAPLNVKKVAAIKEADLQRWSHLDIINDTIPGMSVDRAYAELLKDKKGVPVIVGIVDSGVDIEHEDLKDVLWTNTKEIAGNGIDDDKNGYVDDIHGWNFLGDITKENLEYERIIKNKDLVDEVTYQAAKKLNDDKIAEAKVGKARYDEMLASITKADEIIVKELGKPVYTAEELKAIESKDAAVMESKVTMLRAFSFGLPVADLKKAVEGELTGMTALLSGDNLKQDYRKVLGDNPDDMTDVKYGNNNVMGPDKEEILHGTHVAGIVAQVRGNNLGGDGIANNVQILTVRAVPDGDEYDKDIALGIRYAVDNGAKVINGSFGKSFSPHKQWVYDAIKYAEKKDVLIVHAAGNDGKDIDSYDNFPNDSDDKKTEFADNMITIGALNFEYGDKVVARFSNFGKTNVDVFAPGVKIYATTPNNTYKYLQGTSMASPNVAGVAAIIRSYYPKLTASQVKHILMDSGVAIATDVVVGGNPKDSRSFTTLSQSGKIVNAYNAILMADKMSKK